MLAIAEYDVIVTRAHELVLSRPVGLLAEIVEAVAVKLLGVFVDGWVIYPHSGYTEGVPLGMTVPSKREKISSATRLTGIALLLVEAF